MEFTLQSNAYTTPSGYWNGTLDYTSDNYSHYIPVTRDNGTDIGSSSGAGESVLVIVLKAVAFAVIMFCAIFGNILVIVSVFRFERLRIVTNSFIVSLAFADFLVGLVVMPFNASKELAGKWVFGPIMCDVFNANDVMFSTASLLNLCCISIDRYVAIILDPFHYEQRMSKPIIATMMGVAWGASALISHVPIHMKWYTTADYLDTVKNSTDVCDFIVSKPYAAISSSISFWIPSFILVFAYVKIYREARRLEKRIQALSVQSGPPGEFGSGITDRKRMKREHKATKTLGLILGCFLACWLPFFLWYFVDAMCDPCQSPSALVGTLFWIGYLNSSLNPLIYAFFNREFRGAFKKLLRCNRNSCNSKDSLDEVPLGAYNGDQTHPLRESFRKSSQDRNGRLDSRHMLTHDTCS